MEPLYTRRSLYILLVLGFLVSTLFFGLSLVKQRQELREKAAGATVFTVKPNKTYLAVNDEVVIDVEMSTGADQVTIVDLVINFDPNVFDAISLSNTGYLPTTFAGPTFNNGQARIVVAAGLEEPKQGQETIVQLVLQSKIPVATTQIDLKGTRARAYGQGETDVVASLIPAIIVVTAEETIQQPQTTLSMFPVTLSVSSGQRFYLPVKMNTNGNKVTGVDLVVLYDTNYFDGKNISKGGFLPTEFTSGTVVDGVAKIATVSLVSQPVVGEGIIAVLEFEAKTTGTTTVSIDASTQISGLGGDPNLLAARESSTITIGQVAISPGIGGTCVAAVPSIPSNFTARTGSSNKVELSWSSVSNVTHYGIVYGLSPGVYIYGAANVGNTTQFTVTGLASSTRYYFAVFAANDCAASGFSTEANALSSTSTGGGTIKKTSPSSALRTSPQPSFVPIDPNQPNPFLQTGTQPSPTLAPLFVSVPPETQEAASGSGILSLLTPVRLVIIALILLLGGAILYLTFHKSSVES
ncbi:TPA: hypothetical protein DIV55_01985 [Patescibacteria group bacterium]|uniref:Beta-1,3-glucanase n=1 Tax=Candidatus Gottesmanbacteria bacterium GW2011_GWA1_43_11 TaxID=1618436 RepID=A0A0G1CDM7_9BACT|nr:MAG: Beta-1,3-glucanase [Candidatus Gottesmanbacteria bacterium GW2011_GWA1_43_11]HCS78493.1 hypothetical protein [Patescibacteria group bacterium]